MGDDATLEIMITAKNTSGGEMREAKDGINDMRAAVERLNAMQAAGIPTAVAVAMITGVQAEAYQTEARAATQAAVATIAASSAAGGGIPAWLGWTAAIAVALATLSPFVALVGSAAVILTAFAVAGAATVALLGGLALGFGVLAAALFMADVAGKQVDNGWTTLKANALGFASTLTAQAAPAIGLVIGFLNSLIAPLAQAGSSIITWFGERVPGVLAQISKMIQDLGPTFSQFGQFVGGMFDRFSSQMGPIFEAVIKGAIAAITGLMTNLGALGQWFMERLPTYGPIVSQVFGFIGGVIQGIAQLWGKFADWLRDQWPLITTIAVIAAQNIKDQWDKWAGVLEPLIKAALPALGLLLIVIAQHAGALVPVIVAAIAIAIGFTVALMGLVAGLMVVIEWFSNLSSTILGWRLAAIEDIRQVIAAMNRLPGVNIALPNLPGGGAGSSNTAPAPSGRGGPRMDSGIPAASMATTESLLAQAVDHLATLAGTPPLSSSRAGMRIG